MPRPDGNRDAEIRHEWLTAAQQDVPRLDVAVDDPLVVCGLQRTGNGRRESFAHLTLPRMTNTYMLPGPHAPEEIIASVAKGL